MIKIAVDAMGGDNAPVEIVKGTVKFINEYKDTKVILLGDENAINEVLKGESYNKESIEVVHTTEVISNDDKPMIAIKQKKDSSLVRAMDMVKRGEADGVISAGSTGAFYLGATIIIGKIKGVKRPTLAAILPGRKGKFFLLADSGASVDSKPEYIAQFAVLGSIYMEKMMGVNSPKVGLVNVGTEEAKGDTLTKEAFELLKLEKINFVGNIEAREIPDAKVDVVVCDGFVGNVILKLSEGLGKMFGDELKDSLLSSLRGKIGGLLSKSALKSFKDKFDPAKVGGAPIIGLKGLAVKAHGNSNALAFYSGLKQCHDFVEKDITGAITSYFSENKVESEVESE